MGSLLQDNDLTPKVQEAKRITGWGWILAKTERQIAGNIPTNNNLRVMKRGYLKAKLLPEYVTKNPDTVLVSSKNGLALKL
jgi:hypothetical protein